MTNLTEARLGLCRLVREHATQGAELVGNGSGDVYVRELCTRVLEVPVEEMAGWFNMSDTVLANIRLAMAMVEQSMMPVIR